MRLPTWNLSRPAALKGYEWIQQLWKENMREVYLKLFLCCWKWKKKITDTRLNLMYSCLNLLRMRKTRWWPRMSGSSKYVRMSNNKKCMCKIQPCVYFLCKNKQTLCFLAGMERLQTPLEPGRLRKCHLHPYSLRDHLEAWHRLVQQVSLYRESSRFKTLVEIPKWNLKRCLFFTAGIMT